MASRSAAIVLGLASGVAGNGLRGSSSGLPETLLPPPAITIAEQLFAHSGNVPVGAAWSYFNCNMPGHGTVSVANGPGGCLNAQPKIAGFTVGKAGHEDSAAHDTSSTTSSQTIASFVVEPCGLVAPHNHANAAELNTVIHGQGVIGVMTTQTGKLLVNNVKSSQSFVFPEGSFHWWANLGTEQLVTVGAFVDTSGPDAALFGYDNGAGLVGSLMGDQSLLNSLVGESTGKKIIEPFGPNDSPLFPKLTPWACEAARQRMNQVQMSPGPEAFAVSPVTLFQAEELATGMYSIGSSDAPVNGPGGGLKPLAGQVLPGMRSVIGTVETNYNGGLKPDMTPGPLLWPGLTNIGGGVSLVKFVVGYCGTVAIHTHPNADEWNTVINGEGHISYYQVNTGAKPQVVTMYVKKGDSFVLPKGSAHWWVNYSPDTELVTVGGFTAPFPETSRLESFFAQTAAIFPAVTDGVLGEGYRPARDLPGQDGADTMFPLLSTRQPANCGGSVRCDKCY